MRIVARVDCDVVGVDRTRHEPLIRGGAVAILRGAPQPAVRDVDQRIGHGDRDPLAVRLVGQVVFGGPPDAGAQTFVRGRDPRPAQTVLGECEPPVPRQSPPDPWLAVIPHRDRPRRPGTLWCRQRHEERIAVAPVIELPAVLDHAVNHERHLQIDLHLARGLQNAVRDAIPAADARILRIHPRVQVVELHVPPGPRGSVGAAQRVGVRVERRVLRRRERNQREAGDEKTHGSTNTRSPANFRPLESHGKKITTRKVTRSPIGVRSSHFPLCVPVTRASSHTP